MHRATGCLARPRRTLYSRQDRPAWSVRELERAGTTAPLPSAHVRTLFMLAWRQSLGAPSPGHDWPEYHWSQQRVEQRGPLASMAVSFAGDELQERARQRLAVVDGAVSFRFLDALEVLASALDSEAGLSPAGRLSHQTELIERLVIQGRLQQQLEQH